MELGKHGIKPAMGHLVFMTGVGFNPVEDNNQDGNDGNNCGCSAYDGKDDNVLEFRVHFLFFRFERFVL